MATNAQVAHQAAAVKGELLGGDFEARAEEFYAWLQDKTTTDEVQTLTEGGAGLTSYTITFDGQTTASLDDDATAAQVQAALEALSNLAPGDVVVTGTTNPIAMTVTFAGTKANADQPAMTTTPTGGTGTVDVATTTAGGAAVSAGAIGNAQAALLGAAQAYVHRGGKDGVANTLAAANELLATVAAHAAGQGS